MSDPEIDTARLAGIATASFAVAVELICELASLRTEPDGAWLDELEARFILTSAHSLIEKLPLEMEATALRAGSQATTAIFVEARRRLNLVRPDDDPQTALR